MLGSFASGKREAGQGGGQRRKTAACVINIAINLLHSSIMMLLMFVSTWNLPAGFRPLNAKMFLDHLTPGLYIPGACPDPV